MPEYKRIWFFDSPQDNTGVKFVRKNIPTQETMSAMLDSVAFFAEPGDQGTETKQGLFKVYTDDQAIDNRRGGAVPKGERKVPKASQAPGVVILHSSGDMKESNPTTAQPVGPEVSGSGIKVTGKVFEYAGVKKVAYQVELDISTYSAIAKDTSDTVYSLVWNATQSKHYLYPVTTGPVPGAGGTFVHNQDVMATTWTVNHNLGFNPAHTIEVELPGGGYVTAKTEVNFIDLNTMEVVFSTQQKGRVSCS